MDVTANQTTREPYNELAIGVLTDVMSDLRKAKTDGDIKTAECLMRCYTFGNKMPQRVSHDPHTISIPSGGAGRLEKGSQTTKRSKPTGK